MAGTSGSFNASAFRSAIRFAMDMGAPPATGDRLTFHWNPTATTVASKDGEGVPFDPAATITRTTPPPVTAPCAVEFHDATGEPTPFGVVIPSKVSVVLLDEDYCAVKTADYVVIAGDKYIRSHEPPSVGLFDVGVHTIVYIAENEL
jgi:hypothetical protein